MMRIDAAFGCLYFSFSFNIFFILRENGWLSSNDFLCGDNTLLIYILKTKTPAKQLVNL